MFFRHNCGSFAKCRGFTLIEILVAVFVTTLGLVGLIAMETLTTRYLHNSYLRSQAILQAREMADRMLTNPAGVSSGNYSNKSGIPTSPTCKTSASSTTINCTTSQIATFDLAEWNTTLAQLLPAGAGTISSPTDGVFTLTVSWQEVESAGATTQSFSFAFRPLP